MSARPQKRMDILIQRQLESISTGNGAYLETFLRTAKKAGFRNRLVFAPRHSFGNRPWASIHPRLMEQIDEVSWPGARKIGHRYWTLSPLVWLRFAVRVQKALMRKVGLKPHVPSYLGRPLPKSEERAVAKAADRNPGDLVIAEYSSMGPVLNHLESGAKTGVLMHDLLSDRGKIWRDKGVRPDLYEATLEEEVNWCQSADLMIYASANELEQLQQSLPHASAVWLRPEPPVYEETNSEGAPRIVFLGTTHGGNSDALEHFIEDIWPIVREKRPGVEFWVAGSIGNSVDPAVARAESVKILGRVERLEDIGGHDSIGIAPTRLATGISIKVAEYLMLDMTCVAYPLALKGFKTALDGLVSVVDDPEAFADEVCRLIDDHEKRNSQAAKSRQEAARILANDEVEAFLIAHTSETKIDRGDQPHEHI